MTARTLAESLTADSDLQDQIERDLVRCEFNPRELEAIRLLTQHSLEMSGRDGAPDSGTIRLALTKASDSIFARRNGPAPDPKEWGEPRALDAEPDPADFPVCYLPDPLRAYAEALAEELQVPLELVGPLILTTFSAAFNGKLAVNPHGGWYEGVNIYTGIVMRSGSGKTPAFSTLRVPIQRYEKRRIEETADAVREAESEKRVLEEQRKDVEKKLARARADGSPEEQAELASVRKRLVTTIREHRVPAEPCLVTEDITPERVATVLAEQGERLAILSAESEPFSLMSRYQGDGRFNFDVFLKAWSREYLRQDRQSRAPVVLNLPSLVLGVTIQPRVLRDIAKVGTGLRDRGLIARILWTVPKDLIGSRNMRTASAPGELGEAYDNALTRALTLDFTEMEREGNVCFNLRLSPHALEAFMRFQEWIEPQGARFAPLGHMNDWLSKLRSNVLRLAGILHGIQWSVMGGSFPREIDHVTMDGAVELGRFFLAHARIAYREMSADPVLSTAQRIDEWLMHCHETRFTKRDAQRGALRGDADENGTLDRGLDHLAELDRIREREPGGSGKRDRRQRVFDVNPAILAQKEAGRA